MLQHRSFDAIGLLLCLVTLVDHPHSGCGDFNHSADHSAALLLLPSTTVRYHAVCSASEIVSIAALVFFINASTDVVILIFLSQISSCFA